MFFDTFTSGSDWILKVTMQSSIHKKLWFHVFQNLNSDKFQDVINGDEQKVFTENKGSKIELEKIRSLQHDLFPSNEKNRRWMKPFDIYFNQNLNYICGIIKQTNFVFIFIF